MTPLELQALIGRMLPSDFNCSIDWYGDTGALKVSNWCDSVEACEVFPSQLDQSEEMVQRTLKPFLQQAVKDLRGSQTKNRYSA